ncbi:diguanylate cyclase/phosphodiesterase [Evansella cellulosilytica DSM 2522]|uniref:Diguanylate cyclase/phosphodiesterase n=2 Tax=Evansella TaxID=2837485 RepID=E6TZ16_EVAC2|nr:diguanylate cyclase/phosphodiesterase [Evansella cellulosilytica DSM 2522]
MLKQEKAKNLVFSKSFKYVIVFLLLSFSALITKLFDLPLVFGMTVSFASLFLLLIVRLFSLVKATAIAIVIFIIGFLFYELHITEITMILEVFFIGVILLFRRKSSMVLMVGLFWLIIGVPLTAMMYSSYYPEFTGTLLYVHLAILILSGVCNALIADMILAYTPLERWIKGSKKQYISSQHLILHIIIVAITFPFLINFAINSISAYESSIRSTSHLLSNNARSIESEIKQWNTKDMMKLSLFDTVKQSQLSSLLERNIQDEIYNVVVTNEKNIILSSTNEQFHMRDYFDWFSEYDVYYLSERYYQKLPANQNEQPSIMNWNKGSFIYERPIEGLPLTIYVEMPLSYQQERIFTDFLDQFRFLLIFALVALLMSRVINRNLVSTLNQLTLTTTGLPNKIGDNETIDWPQSNVKEIDLLIENFKYTSTKLKQMFQRTNNMNKELEEQAGMLQKSEEKLQKLAYYDMLTGLPNRQHFQKYLESLLQSEANKKAPTIAVMFVDLNQFKQINDTLGHKVGDELLKLVSNKLMKLEKEKIKVFRLGGDEFVIVLTEADKKEVKRFGGKLQRLFAEPIILNNMSLYVTASFGVSMYPKDGDTLDRLVRFADMAMYNAKEKGRNYIQFFDQSMKADFSERMMINNGLREALERNQFELHYQPKVNAKTDEMSGMEALMRWHHPELGNVSPGKFIPIAEESGLILKIDEWGLLQACKQNKQWQDAGLKKVPVAVNISAKHFYHGYLSEMVKRALTISGLEAQYLQIEITESVFIKKMDDVIHTLNGLQEMGVKVSIDDFGNGFSSLNQLLKLPISEVKLDREFIRNIGENEKQASMVKVIIELAHSLQLNVVGEGVETEDELALLQQYHCDELQGFLFSKPVQASELKQLLQR